MIMGDLDDFVSWTQTHNIHLNKAKCKVCIKE